jgi:hypothetical protein
MRISNPTRGTHRVANLILTREQFEAMREKRSRWSADAEGNVFDADFEHDAMLKISGDFHSNIQRVAYAERIAATLNNEGAFLCPNHGEWSSHIDRGCPLCMAAIARDAWDSALEAACEATLSFPGLGGVRDEIRARRKNIGLNPLPPKDC